MNCSTTECGQVLNCFWHYFGYIYAANYISGVVSRHGVCDLPQNACSCSRPLKLRTTLPTLTQTHHNNHHHHPYKIEWHVSVINSVKFPLCFHFEQFIIPNIDIYRCVCVCETSTRTTTKNCVESDRFNTCCCCCWIILSWQWGNYLFGQN